MLSWPFRRAAINLGDSGARHILRLIIKARQASSVEKIALLNMVMPLYFTPLRWVRTYDTDGACLKIATNSALVGKFELATITS